jgi:RHS repeat-associated protein
MPLALPAPLGESGAGGSAEPYTWVGRQGYQRDTETGFYFLRARMYDPSSGRFVLPDPIGFAAGDANLYRYCGNDPVNHTDPSGLDSNGFGLTDLFFPLPSLAGRLARRDDVRRGAAAAVEGVGQLGRRALDQIPGFQAAVTAVRPCASRLLRDAPGATSSARDFVLGLARTGIPSVGGFARFARPPLTAAVPGLVALAQVPTQDILGLMDRVLRHECTQLLARVAAGVTPQPVAEFLQVLQDRGAGIFQAFQDRGAQVLAWAQALWDTLVARALNILQEIWDYVWPLVQKAPEALRAIGRFAARTAVEGPRKPVGQAIQTLIGLADGPTAKDVIGRIGVYLDGVLPEWQLPEEWVAFVADLFDDLVAAVGDKAGALVELIERPDEVFDSLLGTLRELAWPWGPPLSEQGIIPDFRALLNDAVPKVVTNLWGVWVGGLSCPASLDLSQWLRPLSEAVENAARGGLAVVAFIRDTAARLSGWLAVFGQVVGVLFPGAGNALAGGVNTVVNTLGTVFSTGLDLVEVADAVAGLWRLYEAEDEGDEAAVDRLEELEERLGEAGALGAATAGGWWGGAAGGAAGGLDRDVLVNKLLDTAIQAGVATLLAVVGGAGQRLGRRLAAKLRRVRVPRTSAAARRARKKMRRDMKRGQCCADKARAGVPCCDQRRECPIPRRPRRGGPIPVRPGQCFAAGTVVWARGGERVGVEAVRLGDRVATWLPGEPGAGSGGPDGIADPSGWRAVWLAQEDGEGGRLEVGLLRPAGWLSARGVEGPGGEVELDLPEMGAAGPFAVVEVGPCPAVTPGPGRVVTGLFRHRAGLVYDLRVGGEGVGVTGAHPVWSADRAGWVGAGDLLAGERVLGAGGPVVVAGMGERGEEPVYNLEVDVDHCFRVGTQGILVHNASTPCSSLGQRRRRYSYKVVRIPERRGSPNHVNERVVERAVSWIRPSDFSGGSYADGSAQDWVQHVVGVDEAIAGHIDHAGHVIAREFGGSGHLGQLPLNIFPQNAQVNTDEGRFWKRREIEIRGLFRRGCPMVCVRIMLRYDPNSRYPARPTFLVYDLWVNGTQRPTAQGDNPE